MTAQQLQQDLRRLAELSQPKKTTNQNIGWGSPNVDTASTTTPTSSPSAATGLSVAGMYIPSSQISTPTTAATGLSTAGSYLKDINDNQETKIDSAEDLEQAVMDYENNKNKSTYSGINEYLTADPEMQTMSVVQFQNGEGFGVDWSGLDGLSGDAHRQKLREILATPEAQAWKAAWKDLLTESDIADYWEYDLGVYDGDFDALWDSWAFGDEEKGLLANTYSNVLSDPATAVRVLGDDESALATLEYLLSIPQTVETDSGTYEVPLYTMDVRGGDDAVLGTDKAGTDYNFIDLQTYDPAAAARVAADILYTNALDQAYQDRQNNDYTDYYDLNNMLSAMSAEEISNLQLGSMDYGYGSDYSTDIADYNDSVSTNMLLDPDQWTRSIDAGNVDAAGDDDYYLGLGTGYGNRRFLVADMLNYAAQQAGVLGDDDVTGYGYTLTDDLVAAQNSGSTS